MDTEGITIEERFATIALATRFHIFPQVLAIDGLCEYTGASGLANTPWTAEQERLCQLIILNGILQRNGNVLLANHCIKRSRAVFTGRNNKIIHRYEDRYFRRKATVFQYVYR